MPGKFIKIVDSREEDACSRNWGKTIQLLNDAIITSSAFKRSMKRASHHFWSENLNSSLCDAKLLGNCYCWNRYRMLIGAMSDTGELSLAFFAVSSSLDLAGQRVCSSVASSSRSQLHFIEHIIVSLYK